MKRRVPLLLSAMALLAVVVWVFYADAPTTTEAADVSVAPKTDAGLKVYVDPNTGKFVDPPAQPHPDFPPMVQDDFSRSVEGLVVEDGPVSGKMVNLQGRFRHGFTAVVGADGKLTAVCDLPESAQNDTSDGEGE